MKKGILHSPNSTVKKKHWHFFGRLLKKDSSFPHATAFSAADSIGSLFSGFWVSRWPSGPHSSQQTLPTEGLLCRENPPCAQDQWRLCSLLPGHRLSARIMFWLMNLWSSTLQVPPRKPDLQLGPPPKSSHCGGSFKLTSLGSDFWDRAPNPHHT